MKSIVSMFLTLGMIVPLCLSAGNEDRLGTAGATQLLINPWARSAALANSNVATVRGIEGAFMNVAGLAFTRKTELMFTNTNWMKGSGISINSIGLSQRVGESSVLGLSVMSVDFGDLVTSTESAPEGDGSTFSVNNLNIGLSYAKEFSNSIYGGLTVRMISETIFNAKASGVAFDAGIKYVSGERDQIHFGIALKNVGPPISFSGDGLSFQTTLDDGTVVTAEQRSSSHEIPSLIQIGVGYDFVLAENHDLTATGAFVSNSFSRDNLGVGLNYSFKNMFILRGGYQVETGGDSDSDRTTFLTGLTAGLSLQAPIGKNGGAIGFDYTYRDTSPFDGVHSVGVRIDI